MGYHGKANKPADNASTTPLLLSWLCVNMNGFFNSTMQYPTPSHSSMASWAQVRSTLKTLTTIASPFANPICAPGGKEDDNDDDADNSTNTERLFDVLANLMYSASCLLRFLLILIRLHLGKWRSYQIKAKIRDVKEGET